MQVPFWKMEGAGNDFVVFDNRDGFLDRVDWTQAVRHLCDRRRGIGADGVLLLRPHASLQFTMRYLNADGGEVDMCGNGARCLALLAWRLGPSHDSIVRFESRAGIHSATISADGRTVSLRMTAPHDLHLNTPLHFGGHQRYVCSVNTGVPHVVSLGHENLAAVPVAEWGSEIRHAKEYAPSGTNANFGALIDGHTIRLRTFERGVEAETLACGTGAVATALVATRLDLVEPPVTIIPTGGDALVVSFERHDDVFENITLSGPVLTPFVGTVEL